MTELGGRAIIAQRARSSRARPMSIAKADFIEGMAKGLAVLESFDTQRQRLNATLAAQRAGITRAAARRHLLTLAHLGYLETDGSYFWLSPKVLRFSGSYLASARLPRVIQPTLDRLAARTGESFSAVVLEGDASVIVARSGAVRMLAYGMHLGAPACSRDVHRPRAAGGKDTLGVQRLDERSRTATANRTHDRGSGTVPRADRGGPAA
jgi:DNA-binding IclR family transcriptional regulator